MRKPRRGLLALAATAGVAATLIAPSAAYAAYYGDETDYAVSSSGPVGTYYCTYTSYTGARVCFQPYGDLVYVKDTNADGYAAVGEWIGDGFSRTGSCVNKLGNGNWGVCNKDFPENQGLYITGARYSSGNPVDSGGSTWVPTS
ncbi:hypothetical protein AB0J86_10800 [Micromonospora sp. NPDC049559]|uniref:hypothetical protein n=1 Tax=Micromonospora sp. NPDC049559 TaxID=3155923 RepID=UPI00343686A3